MEEEWKHTMKDALDNDSLDDLKRLGDNIIAEDLEDSGDEFNLKLNEFYHHPFPEQIFVWTLQLLVKLLPVILNSLSLIDNIHSNFYFYEFGFNLAYVISNLVTAIDWALDLQLIRPTKPWSRYDPHYVIHHRHEQN